MSSREGGQSPPPETQSGAQVNDAPAGGQGVDSSKGKSEVNKTGLEVSLHN